ncbi:MAG: S-layer homology domain-containing protein [Bacillota bacterium]
MFKRFFGFLAAFLLMMVFAASPAWPFTTEWYPSGPYGGNVNCMLSANDAIFVGTSYGVFRSTDGGATWEDVLVANCKALVADPVSGAVYAGTEGGVFVSSNGTSWQPVGSVGMPVEALACVRGAVYAAGSLGVMCCEDGANWVSVYAATRVSKMCGDPSGNIYAWCPYSSEVLENAAGTSDWTAIGSGVSVTDMSCGEDGKLYMASGNTFSCYDGASWAMLTPPWGNWPNGQAARVYSDKILVGSNSGGLRVSTDGGSTWTAGTSGLYGGFSVTCVHKDPVTGYLFLGTPLGLYRSTDGGATVGFSSQGLKWGVSLNSLEMVAADANTLFARNQYGFYKSTDGGQTWAPFLANSNPLPYQSMVVTNDNCLVFGAGGDAASSGIWKIGLDGSGLTRVFSQGICSVTGDIYGTLYSDSGSYLTKSTDNGATWATFGPSVPLGPYAKLVMPDGTVYVGSYLTAGIYRLPAGGSSWQLVNDRIKVRRFASDGTGRVYACGGGLSGYGVYVTADGTNWTACTGVIQVLGSSGYSVSAIATDSQNSVYVGNASGIAKSVDGGATWFEFATGIPSGATVYHLFATPGDILFALTDQGIYDPPGEVDNVCPSGSISVSAPVLPSDGLPFVTEPTVQFLVYGEDNDGVVDIAVNTGSGFEWREFTGSPMTLSVALSSPGGKKTVTVRLRDVSGNTADITQALWYDAEAPSITYFSPDYSVVTSPSATFRFSVAEDVLPTEVMLSENPDFAGASWAACDFSRSYPEDPFFAEVSVSLSSEGTKTIYAKVRDYAGRESEPAFATVTYLKPAFTPEKISTSAWECAPSFDEGGAMYYIKDGDLYAFDVQETRLTTGKGIRDPVSVRSGIAAYRGSSGIEILMIGTGETISTGMWGTPPVTDGVYVAFEYGGDIYLYDVAAGSGRYLTTDGYSVAQDRPALGGGKVFCTEGGAVVAMDIGTGEKSVLASPDWISGPCVAGDHVYWIGLYGTTCRLERIPLDGGSAEVVLTLSTEAGPYQYYLGGVSPDGRYALVWIDALYVLDLVSAQQYMVTADAWDCAISPEWLAWTECDWDSENLADVCYAPLSQLEGAPSAPVEEIGNPPSSPGYSSGGGGGRSANRSVKVDLAAGGSATLTVGSVSVTLEAADSGSGEAMLEGIEGGVAVKVTGEPAGLKVVVSGGALCMLDRHLDVWVPVSEAVYGVVGAVYREAGRTTVFLEKDGEFMVFEKVPAVEAHVAGSRLVGRVKGVSSVLVVLNGGRHTLEAKDGTFGMDLRLGPGKHSVKCVVEHNGQKFLCWQKSFWRYGDFDEKHWAYKTAGSFLEDNPVFGEVAFLYPDSPAKRGEIAKLLKAALNLPDPGGEVPFGDVPAEDEALASAARAVYDADLMVGYPDGTLGAGRDISRVETAVLLARLAKRFGVVPAKPAPAFRDFGQVPAWAREAVKEAAAIGIVSGYPDGTFRPLRKVTRAESAVLTLRTARLKSPGLEERAKGI